MSGGSYDYLYIKDIDELVQYDQKLREMSDRLAELGYANDAARETEDFLLTLRQFRNRMEARKDRLYDIWKAVEMYDSGDWGEESVKESLEEYRSTE